jgi:CheY-like chemotaxis protein
VQAPPGNRIPPPTSGPCVGRERQRRLPTPIGVSASGSGSTRGCKEADAAAGTRSLGYRVVSVTSATDALRILGLHEIDVVLTDVVMPGMNGFQLALRIREAYPGIPIICITGYANVAEDARHCDILLRKPYSMAGMAKALKSVLAA